MAGDIRKRESGRWAVRYRYTDATGRIVRKTLGTFPTKREAERAKALKEAQVLQGDHIDPRLADRPYSAAVGAWKATWTNRLQPTTRARYEGVLTGHLEPEFGQTPLSKLTKAKVQKYVGELHASGAKPGTVQKVFQVLRSSLNAAVDQGWIRTNPCDRVQLPRIPRQEMLFLSADEVAQLAEAVPARYRTMIYFAAFTGLRAGEIGGLRVKHLDLLRGTVRVEETLLSNMSKGEPKTSRSRRSVSIPKFLCAMLAEHVRVYPAATPGPDGFVFTKADGEPIRHANWYGDSFRPAVKKVLPHKAGLRFHDLRHTAASLLIAQGAHPKVIQERLGHASIAITMDRYGHLLPALDEAAVVGLEAAYRAATPATAAISRIA